MDQDIDYNSPHGHGYQQEGNNNGDGDNVDENYNGDDNNMTDEQHEVQQRRSSIQHILQHPKLTNKERRHSIQILMDARRRCSFGSTFAEAARNVAAEFISCNSNSTSSNNSCTGVDDAGADMHTHASCATMSDDYCDNEKKCSKGENTNINSTNSSTSKRTGLNTCYKMPVVAQTKNEIGFENEQETQCDSDSFSTNQKMKSNEYRNFCQPVNSAYTLSGEPTGDPKQMEQQRPQCTHYQRNCSIISPCCGMVFGCRICHDECEHQIKPFMRMLQEASHTNKKNHGKRREVTEAASAMNNRPYSRRLSLSSFTEAGDEMHHEINRKDVSEIICRECFTRQSSKTNNCINCNAQFGEYHCNICNLWMESDREPYHCHDCGICRVGGKDNFKHCHTCGMCIDKKMFDDHNCQAGKFMAKCPVCYEDLFSSRSACHELPCNHSMHWQCFVELSSVDIRCPLCKKTMIDGDEREELWRELKRDIAMQPIPPDLTKIVDIVCIDCETAETNRRWHPLGVDCSHCGSFNTSIDITMVGVEANNILNQLENQRRV